MENSTINISTNLQDFFHHSIETVIEKHHVDLADDTVWYLTQLLCNYSRAHRFFDDNQERTQTPLAEYYRQSVEASSEHERRLLLQRLGDVALFISSLFSGSLKRKPVNVRYYISMGEAAYGTLAGAQPHSTRDKALHDIFSDLSSHFGACVSALSDIPAKDNQRSLLETVEEWEQTRHPALARTLREHGVFLLNDSDRRH